MKPAPYVFHCTPCGFAHAGECEKKVKASYTITHESTVRAKAAIANIAAQYKAAVAGAGAFKVPVIAATQLSPSIPAAGSRWLSQERALDGSWHFTGFEYEVDSFDAVTQDVSYRCAGSSGAYGTVYQVDLMVFSSVGLDIRGNTFRMIDAKSVVTPNVFPGPTIPALNSLWHREVFTPSGWVATVKPTVYEALMFIGGLVEFIERGGVTVYSLPLEAWQPNSTHVDSSGQRIRMVPHP